jgi:hypothetical protein
MPLVRLGNTLLVLGMSLLVRQCSGALAPFCSGTCPELCHCLRCDRCLSIRMGTSAEGFPSSSGI